jgi:adenosylcobinamide-phosphate synthase
VSRALGILLGFAADRLLGDPQRFHPVAGFGRIAAHAEKLLHPAATPGTAGVAGRVGTGRGELVAGMVYAGVLVGGTAGLGLVVERLTRKHPILHTVSTAVATWTVLGARSLEREAEVMAELLEDKDIPGARDRLSHLCARDATDLEADELARATVESIAENTSDACVAPLVWGGVLGIPGLLGYRAANTLDAMVGYKSPKYLKFGWAAARLDDALNLLPARVCALLTGLAAGRVQQTVSIWWRDAAKHPSPNAGPVEAAFAGALGLTLGGTNSYGSYQEDRGTLGDGPAPTVADVRRTAALARRVGLAAAGVAALAAVLGKGKRWG